MHNDNENSVHCEQCHKKTYIQFTVFLTAYVVFMLTPIVKPDLWTRFLFWGHLYKNNLPNT
jgi:hypothetical protein